MQKFCETIISKSMRYPLVSGFLKLMESAMYIGSSTDYFNIEKSNILTQSHRIAVVDSITHYLKYVITKAQQTYGELQLACIHMIFVSPVVLLKRYLADLVPVFIVAFDMGKSMLHIANKAVDCLSKLTTASTSVEPNDDFDHFLQMVLPCLDVYLQSNGFDSNLLSNENDFQMVKFKNTKRSRKILKLASNTPDSELLKLQKKIIIYIGKFYIIFYLC